MKKRLFIFSVALLSIIQFNYGYNVINTNEIANAISKKDAKNSFSENFYSSYEANWENLENFNTEFNQSAFASKQFTAISASALKATNYTNASASFSQLESIPVGSYVIAMDDALQPDGNSFNLKAYGLIVRLLHADIPLKWAINSAKVKDGLDFSVAASRIKPTTQTSQSRAFRGGPIIIAPGYESQALTVINAFNNGVYVYETTAAVDDVEIYSDLTHKPKAAVFNDGGKSKIHTDIYKDAGLSSVTHYNAVANSATIINAASCYTFASEPHSDHNDTDKKNNVELFLKSGGNFLAQCHGVESYTRLGLLANFVDKNDEGAETYSNFSEPFAQFIGLLPDEGGSVKDFELLNEPLSGKSIIARPNNHHVAYVGKITGVTTTNGGYVHYLGGHEHDHINGQRLLLNALLTPADRPTDCNLNICLNVLDQGTMSTPRDTYLCTSYPIVNLIIPPITPTAATGGSGGAIEYQWQKRHGGGSSWTNITGATNANYNPPNSPYNGTTQPYGYVLGETYYRRGAKTTCASSYKYTEYKYYWITRNVENPGSIGGDEVSCGQYDPSNIWNITYANGGGGSSIQYQWQESTDGIAWNNIVGANAATYNPANISVTMQYRRGAIRTWEGCSTSYMYSNTITKTVDNTILNLECEYKIDGGSWIANDCSVLITQGQKLELSTNPNNLASYSWSGPNSFSGTGGNGGDILVSDSMTAAMTGTYTVVATNSNGCSATTQITVTAQNAPPVAVNDTASTNEDTPVDISILTNDSDPDGTLNVTSVDLDPATLGQQTSFTVPTEGTYTVNNLGVVTFTPILNFNGTTTPINYTVNDNDGLTSNIATITVTVNDVNDPPVAVNDTASTNEDTPVDISILTNDSDPDGTLNVTSVDLDPATLGQQTSFTVPAEGTYTVNNLGVVTFTPILNFNGTTTPINYTVNDNDGLTSNIATITVTVNDVNDPPVAVNDTASTNEDTPVDISILTNDSDPDGTLNVTSVDLDPATLGQQTSFTVPAEGTYTVNNLGVVTFTPILNFNGTTTPINYTVNDNDGLTSNIATITVTVNDVNDPPVAVNDTASTNEDTPVDISILTNDSDPDGTLNVTSVDLDPATLGQQTSFTVPAEGTYTVNNLGVVTFTPILNFNGTTTPINYTVNDNDGLTSNIATITVTVNDVNDPPVAVNDTASTNEDTPVDISILTNDSDPDGTLNVTSVDLDPATLGQQTSFTVPAEGTYTVNNLGVVTFTPILNFNGTTTPINYTVNDNDGLTSNIATITVTVNDVNDPPVAVNDTASTNEDTPVDISILTNDSDPDGTLNVTSVDLDPATLGQQTSFTVPAEGTYTVNNLGVVTFTPILNFNGTTTPINYTVNDNDGLTSNIATITVTVNDVNDPPVAVNDTASTNEDTPVDISILTNDSDPDGTLNVTSVDLDPATLGQQTSFTVPAEGTYTVNNLGVVTFTPILNFNGTTTPINYTVNDNDGLTSNIATITVTVNDVNDPPVAVNDTASTNEDTPVDISILTNDSDPDGTLNVTSVDLDPATPGQQTSFTVVGEGTYTVDNAGVVTFDPAENFNGVTTPIDYTVDDNDGLTSNVATVTITVTAQNDPPVATDDTYIMDQDTSIILTPLTEGVADSDPDNDTLVIASINGKPVILGTPKTILVPNGSVNYSATGVVTFTPTPGYVGTSSFPYTISDGNGGTDDATENITVLLAPAPALTLEKTANTATYNVVGDIITYSYKVTNSGNVILDGPFTIADNKITVSNITVSLAPGAFETVTATYAVTQADLDNGNIINIASATDTVTGTTSPEDTVTVTAVQNPALTLEKSANVTSYSTVDEVITYSYKVTNSGNVTLDGPFTIADNKITVSDITVALAPGEFETVTATYTIVQADLDNGNIINIASATDTVTGTTSLTDTVTVDANQNPALTLKKTSDEATYAAVGEVITYRYKVTNSGNVTLDGPFTIADNKITVSDITVALAPGEFETVTATHTITQADLDNGNIINIASATDTVTGTTSLTDTVTVDANQNPALTFEKTANVTTYNSVGEVIIYSYKIINSGNVTLDGPFSISDDKITVADAIGSIAPGESLTVTQTYRITQADIDAGFITNIASASNGTATSPTDTVTITADVNPALTLDKTANVTTYDTVGDQIIYSYKVTNSGDVVISGPISITDDKITVSATIGTLSPGASITVTQAYIVTQADLDAGFITNVASASNGVTTSPTDTVTVTAVESPALTLEKTANVSTYTAIGDQIIYSYKVINSGNVALAGPFTITDDKITVADGQGPLSPGASVTVTETYTITQADLDAGLITNVASVTDGTTTSPTDTVTVNIYIAPAPALTLEKTANTATYSVGDVIIYNYRVINSGNVTLDGPFAINDDKISIAPAVGILTPGESVTVTQTYITTQADYDAGSITNIASTTDGTTTSPEVSLTINAVDAPALTLEKTANVNTYTAVGDQIIYTYKVINSGNVALAGPFVITDDKITVQDAPGPLFPGESSTVTETYTVTQADLDAGSITNIAFASYGATTSPTDAVTVNVFVVPAPALTLEKTANATTYSTVGEVIIYSYKIINSGNVTLDGPFSITDDKIAVADAIGSIAPGESLTVTQTYIITQADIDAGSITNVASTSNGTTTSPTDTVTITADVNPALTLDKTANVTTYDTVGDQIIYSYKVTNSGDVLISGPISITDDKITVSATIGTLSPGVSITVTQTYIITQADLDAGSITNVASATNGVTTSPTDTVTVTATTPTGLGSIGDTVWYDTDGDGIVDAGEPGLMGVTVTLDPGTPGNPTDDVPAITDVNGNYLFENLPVGVYTVTVDISTLTGGLPAGKTLADIIPISDGDGVGTPNTITLTLPSGQNNLDQDFAYGVSSGNTGTGNNGGVESESLGDAISKIYVGRKKNSMPTEFVKSSENLYNKVKLKSIQPYQGKGQTLLDMFPTELVAGNVANVTSPTDILDYTIADEVLSVDFSINGETKGVVLGIKTSDKIYNHTKASCDRLRGAEILNVQKVRLEGYNFLMQGIKQRNGVVEYAISFAVSKNNNDDKYTIQTNWYVNNYIKFNDAYNFQVWSTKPADTQKLVRDILDNLKSYIPVQQTEVQKFPETYASKIYREKGELVVNLRSTQVGNTAEVSMVELYSETANNIKHRYNSLDTEIQQSLRLDIADGYEYDGLVTVEDEVEDAFYHADGNWGLDYDSDYTEILNYFVWNDFDRTYQDDEYSINRNVEIKATSEYDYLTVYKSLLPGTLSADYSEYKYLSFTAKGSGLMELGLIKSSIERWKQQYRVMVDLSEEEQTYYVPFDIFSSTGTTNKITADDLTTLAFTFLPVEANTKDLDLFISNVKFTKTAIEDQIVNKIEKFENNFMAYPNPSKGSVNVMIFSKVDTKATISLFDVTGKEIYVAPVQLINGKNEIDFNVKVKPGVLFLKVNSKKVNYGVSKIMFR